MLAQDFLGKLHHFDAFYYKSFVLEAGEYSAYKAAFYCRGLKDYKCFLHDF